MNKMQNAQPSPDHDEIDNMVRQCRDVIDASDSCHAEILESILTHLGTHFNLVPESRLKIDLYFAAAYLEHVAGQLRDEIADGAYRQINRKP